MWRLSGELAVNCSTLVDLPRQTHGLRWMRDELMAPPDQRLTLNGADDVQHWRQTLSGRTSILALLHSGSRAPAHTTYTGCVVVPAVSVSPSEAVSRDCICGCATGECFLPKLSGLCSTHTDPNNFQHSCKFIKYWKVNMKC